MNLVYYFKRLRRHKLFGRQMYICIPRKMETVAI